MNPTNTVTTESENKFFILGDERVSRLKSPEIFSAMMKQVGMEGTYGSFNVEPGKIREALNQLRYLKIAGANVTAPYKETIMPYMDELSEGAMIIGSINTIVRKGDGFKGYNTNAIGFMDALKEANFEAAGKSALVFGAGGAARAVVFILNWVDTNPILIAGRSPEKTRRIIRQIGGGEVCPLDTLPDRPLPVHLLVNATSVSSPEEAPELAELVERLQLPDCELVIDLNYGRAPNFWQEMAQTHGIPFVDGLSTLINQARRTFALWTGIHVESELISSIIQSTSATQV